jgi:pimeloyl-ACP methyl ester carboxylesterase
MAYLSRPDGTVLHYEDFNFAFPWEERGSPVVLMHGLGCNWTLWIKQLAWLVPSRRVIAVDARGSGQSRPAAQGWSTRDMAADLRAVVEDARLVKPVLVGLSMGGTIVLQYALDYPDALSHLVFPKSTSNSKSSSRKCSSSTRSLLLKRPAAVWHAPFRPSGTGDWSSGWSR